MNDQLKDIYRSLAERYPDDIEYPFDEIINILGFDTIATLSERFGGTSIYIPKLRSIFREHVNECIREEFDGSNYNELALKYEICERSVRNIVDKTKVY